MTPKIILCLALVAFNLSSHARLARSWSDAELMAASDLVVVGQPIKVKDLDEVNTVLWPGSSKLLGVEATFAVSKVLKGDFTNRTIVLHYYRWESPYKTSDPMSAVGHDVNSPGLIYLTPTDTNQFLLYLVSDGASRYAPASGQIDGARSSIKPPPKNSATDTNLLRVVVIPSKTEVRVKETFKVALRVENPTNTNQTVRVMSCSWGEEWKSSNTNISWPGWICTINYAVNIEIPPGGAYTNELEMLIPEPISEKKLSFRMGFTPIGSKKTFWSDEVKLNILPPDKGEATNSFGIYLTAEAVDRRITGYGQGNWSHIRLLESPLISAADINSYNFTEHSMRLRRETLAKIPQPPVEGTPFVVVANGERIYLGVFVTCISSMSFAVPTIVVDRRTLVTNQPPDILVIERAYPQPSFGIGPDPRGDQRVKTVLNTLHKLKGEHP